MNTDKTLYGVSELLDIADRVLEANGYAVTECEHGVSFNEFCGLCDPEAVGDSERAAHEDLVRWPR